MTTFELFIIFLVPVRRALFWNVSDFNLHWIILEGNRFLILSSYEKVMLLFNSK